jgi:hypothetical protein
MEKQTLTTLKVVPIVEAVVFPMVAQSIANGRFSDPAIGSPASEGIKGCLSPFLTGPGPVFGFF